MKSVESKQESQFTLSGSVISALELVGREKPVNAATFTQAVFKIHEEYAGHAAASLQLKDTPVNRPAQEWVDEVLTLFDPEHIQSYSNQKASSQRVNILRPVRLHGRLLVIGLSLMEPALREQLENTGVLSKLVDELEEPLQEILTERGRELWNGKTKESNTDSKEPDLSDSVPNWPDDPLQDPEQDLLGRAAFARFLAKRIAVVSPGSGAFSMHISGPWGAGKSSLLNFLRKELEQKKTDRKAAEWLVVEFNAWRHQHIQPPWWSLMEHVFKTTRSQLSFRERLQEYWWRFNTGRLQYIIGAVVLAWVLALVVFPLLGSSAETGGGLKLFADNAENISKILALVATIWGSILAVNRSLLLGAAHAAQNYTDLTSDPTNEIKRRFTGLIKKLLPARVAILIDDLDRCQSQYVVDLLEGMQTLFREAPVVFVVAADRRWLNACYEDVYDKLRARIHEPGKSLGYLFLEKAFRFSTPMPGLSDELKDAYWRHLLQLTPSEQNGIDATIRNKAREDVSKAQSEREVRSLVDSSRGRSFSEQRALREEAVVRLAAPEIQQRLEHTLKPYARYLEPNPRAMKLLVNSYSANRALAILAEVEIELHQLALWTILSSRWPQIADYLAEEPEKLKKNGQLKITDFPADLQPLFTEPMGIRVILGAPAYGSDLPHGPLSFETLYQCARMRS